MSTEHLNFGRLYLLLILSVGAVFLSNAQSPEGEIKKIGIAYLDLRTFEAEIDISFKDNSGRPIEKHEGLYVKDGKNYYLKTGYNETLRNHSYLLTIDHKRKFIAIGTDPSFNSISKMDFIEQFLSDTILQA